MSEIFDRDFLSRLTRIRLAAHLRLDQGQTGGRKSSAKGASVEFSDFREYLPGDDIRRIDWNAYGRFDKLYIKQFMEEKEVFYHILIDNSASMNYGEKPKSRMAVQLAAVFAWLAQKQLDRVEVLTCADGRLDKLSPVVGRMAYGRLLNELEALSFEGKTDLRNSLLHLPLQGKGVCILLSDFWDPQGMEEALKLLCFQKQEVLLIRILAREELDFSQEGTLAIQDMETGEELRVSMTRDAIESYQEAVKKHQMELEKLAARYGCRFLSVASDDNLEEVVFAGLRQKGIFL